MGSSLMPNHLLNSQEAPSARPELQRESEVLLAWLVAEHVVTGPPLPRLRLSLFRDPPRVFACRTTAFVLQPLDEREHFLHVALTNHLQQQ